MNWGARGAPPAAPPPRVLFFFFRVDADTPPSLPPSLQVLLVTPDEAHDLMQSLSAFEYEGERRSVEEEMAAARAGAAKKTRR